MLIILDIVVLGDFVDHGDELVRPSDTLSAASRPLRLFKIIISLISPVVFMHPQSSAQFCLFFLVHVLFVVKCVSISDAHSI